MAYEGPPYQEPPSQGSHGPYPETPPQGPYPPQGPHPPQGPYPPQGPHQGPYQGPHQGPPGYGGVPTYQYSDWIHRVGGFLIDWVPFMVLYFIGLFTGRVLYYLLLLIGVGYWAYVRWVLGGQGQSYGKRVIGMRLVSEETGQPIGTLNAFLRDVCHFIDSIICFVGFLFPLWDAKRQTIADKIMRTVVVPALSCGRSLDGWRGCPLEEQPWSARGARERTARGPLICRWVWFCRLNNPLGIGPYRGYPRLAECQ